MERDIVDIVKEDIIDKMESFITVTRVLSTGPEAWVFSACNFKWLRVGEKITDEDLMQWEVTEINNEQMTVTVTAPNETATLKRRQRLEIRKPTYVHGTHKVANLEWKKSVNGKLQNGVPLIWLVETIQGERYPKDHAQLVDYTTRLFFLHETDPRNSLNAQQREQGVKLMQQLVAEFYETIERERKIRRNNGAFEQSISRFGNENKAGMYEEILSANLGGIEIRPVLTIPKSTGCC